MLICIKFYSPSCHACESTEHLWQYLRDWFSQWVYCHEESVAEPEAMFQRYGSRENFFAQMMFDKFHLPIDVDDSITEEEKEDLKARGETKSYGLPFFVFIDTNNPHEFELVIGGVGMGYTRKDEEEFLKLMVKTFLRLLRKSQGLRYDEAIFRRIFDNPFSGGMK